MAPLTGIRGLTRCRLASLVVTACLLMLPACAEAASHAAKILYATGDVSILDGAGTRRAVSKGDLVLPGETVVTGEGRSQLKLTDGGFVALDANTAYAIDEYAYDAASPDSGKSFFNLLRGGVRFVTGAIGKVQRRNWRMRTAVATIGIRGTRAYTRYGDAAMRELLIDVEQGTLEATDPVTGEISVLEQGVSYRCSSPCRPIERNGAADAAPLLIPDDAPYEAGEDAGTLDHHDHGQHHETTPVQEPVSPY